MRRLFETENPLIDFRPVYNAAPSLMLPVIRYSPETRRRHLDLLRWGLVPPWAKDVNVGYKMINARCETVAEKLRERAQAQAVFDLVRDFLPR